MSDDIKSMLSHLSRMMPGERCDEVENASGQFGYEKSNPIPADGAWYCSRLRCIAGHPYWFHRLGSLGNGPDGHIVDHIELLCFGRENHIWLFFDMYHHGASSYLPKGLSLSSPEGKGTMRRIIFGFPGELESDTA